MHCNDSDAADDEDDDDDEGDYDNDAMMKPAKVILDINNKFRIFSRHRNFQGFMLSIFKHVYVYIVTCWKLDTSRGSLYFPARFFTLTLSQYSSHSPIYFKQSSLYIVRYKTLSEFFTATRSTCLFSNCLDQNSP